MIRKTPFSLITIIFISSCSFEQDTRLICECSFEQRSYNSSQLDVDNSAKTECINEEKKSLIFNKSKKKFDFEGGYLGDPSYLMFTDDYVSISYNNKTILRDNKLNRITQILTLESGLIEPQSIDNSFGFKFEEYYRAVWQCEITQGI